jgi:hypothetical protein
MVQLTAFREIVEPFPNTFIVRITLIVVFQTVRCGWSLIAVEA